MASEQRIDPINVGGVEITVHPGVYAPYYVRRDDLLYKLPDLEKCRCVLDMGTGTGVLPVLWAENFPDMQSIVAVDSNPAAVANAKENAARHRNGGKIAVIQSDLFDEFERHESSGRASLVRRLTGGMFDKFDAIVFNGPHLDLDDARLNDALAGALDPAVKNDLCDFGLRTASRFFAKAWKYLNDDGFIIYTSSDYCRIEKLFGIIAGFREHPYLATFLSIMEFRWKSLERAQADNVRPPHKKVHLWYNIKVKAKDWMVPSELTRGFRKAIVSTAGYYMDKKRVDKPHITEHREKTKALLRCLTAQVDHLIGEDEWLASGFSLPDWDRKQPEHTLLYSFGRQIRQEQEKALAKAGPDGPAPETLDDRLARLVSFMQHKPGFVLIIGYLASPNSPKVIEASKGTRTRMDYLPGAKKLTYEFKESDLVPLTDHFAKGGPTTVQEYDIQIHSSKIDREIRKSESYKQTTDEQLAVDSLRVARNLWLNFSAIKVEGTERGVRYIKFTKVIYPMSRLSGSVYFFSALEPTQENNDLLAALEELFGIANDNLLTPIWISIRNEYALRSAIAAIMSRNMSHNLGSHVLWHLSQKLEHMAAEYDRES